MRIPRTILLTAALAVVPIATTQTLAMATTGQPTLNLRQADNPPPLPGLPNMKGQRGHCMEHKGFGPMQHKPDQPPPGPEKKPSKDGMQSAKDCGFGGFPGFGRHRQAPMTDEQRACMAKKGFGPMHRDLNRPDEKQRPNHKKMDKRRQDFEKAAKECGVQPKQGFPHDPMDRGGPNGPMDPDKPYGPLGHDKPSGPMDHGKPGDPMGHDDPTGPDDPGSHGHGGSGGGGGGGGSRA